MKKKPWYQDGLRFKCTECGKCCTGSPGFVWLTEKDIFSLSQYLKIPRERFLKKYTRLVFGRIALLEYPNTYDCVFFKDRKCSVYSSRPQQCRKFPFWKEIIESPKSWEKAKQTCEGIDHPDAPVISFAEMNQ